MGDNIKILHFERTITDESVTIKGLYMRYQSAGFMISNRKDFHFIYSIQSDKGNVVQRWSFDEKMSERERRNFKKLIFKEIFEECYIWQWEYFLEHLPKNSRKWLDISQKKGL